MRKLHYSTDIRDKNDKRFQKPNGEKVLTFTKAVDYSELIDDSFIERACKRIAESYQAICKDGADITVEVLEKSYGGYYSCMFSYYASYNKFVKH